MARCHRLSAAHAKRLGKANVRWPMPCVRHWRTLTDRPPPTGRQAAVERRRCYDPSTVTRTGQWTRRAVPARGPDAEWVGQQVYVGISADPAVIHGLVVAQAGWFKTANRGRFDESSLLEIQRLWPAAGLPCNAEHANMTSDRLTFYLGRIVDPRRNVATVTAPDGHHVLVPAIRADLVFDPAARRSPHGDLVGYFLERVRNDPSSLSSSLVLDVEVENDSYELPPLWHPLGLMGCDLVSCGDAVGGLLGHAGTWRTLCKLAREWKSGALTAGRHQAMALSAPWWAAPEYPVAAAPAGRQAPTPEPVPRFASFVGRGGI